MSAFCLDHGVRLLAYGTLAGGLISESWVGRLEPSADEIADWSKSKYKRFIDAIGGWDAFQGLLAALATIAAKHGVSARQRRDALDSRQRRRRCRHRRRAARRARPQRRQCEGVRLRVGCARPVDDRRGVGADPTAPGRLRRRISPPAVSHRVRGSQPSSRRACRSFIRAVRVEGRVDRWRVSSGSFFEPIAGYSRAVRVQNRILVSGTTATHGASEFVCPGDPAGQTVFILDKIAASLTALGRQARRRRAHAGLSQGRSRNGSRSAASTAAISAKSGRPIHCWRSHG